MNLPDLTPEQAELMALLLTEAGLTSHNTISPRPNPHEPAILSSAQQRLWFLDQLEPGQATYNIPMAFRLQGELNLTALQRALETLTERHDILRTTYEVINAEPQQIIHPTAPLHIDFHSVSHHPAPLTEAQRLAHELAQRPFDLAQGAIWRAHVIQLHTQDHVLLLVIHHIAYDEGSDEVLFRELSALYAAFTTHQPNPLPPMALQYADYAMWQRQTLASNTLTPTLTYWREKLAGAPPLLELPTDRPRPAQQRPQGATYTTPLPETLLESLKTLSQETQTTLFMITLAAFQVLLFRYTQQTDLVIGTPVANRPRPELDPLIGFFVNTLALRADLTHTPTFRQLLAQVRQTTLEALDRQDVPFEKLVESLGLARHNSYQPLVQVMFAYEHSHLAALNLIGLQLSPFPVTTPTAKFDLTLTIRETAATLSLALEYKTDLFDPATIERMAGHYQILLNSLITHPDEHISHLPLLTAAEHQQILITWNNTARDYPHHQCLHELFTLQAARTPEAVAVIMGQLDSTPPHLTYRQLNARANHLAHKLQQLGIKPDTLVGICVERSLEMVVGLLGILKAGGAYVPLDPTYPPDRLAYMLADSQAPIILTQQRLMATLPPHSAQVLCLDDPELVAEAEIPPVSAVKSDNLMYVIYTSGSTGRPKGAMNHHMAVCNRILWMQEAYQLQPSDRVLQKTPFSFDVSGWEFYWPLITGATIVMAQPEGHKDTAYLIQVINQAHITTLHFVPSMLQIFLQDPHVETCTSLKRVICSGEALSYSLQQQFFSHLQAELHNLYGPTEAAIDVSYWPCQPHARQIVPIGYPIANVQLYILDNYLQPVPIGITGELYIGGVGVGRGYWNNPQLTQERFIPNPFDPESRLYKTGDLVRYDPHGAIEYLGRRDHQVKIRGFRIELGEIETVLSQHEAIQTCAVIAQKESQTLAAYIVVKRPVTPSELRQYLATQLPEYMIPATFMTLEKLPLSPNGKVDLKALPAPTQAMEATYTAPRTPLEQLITHVWEEALGRAMIGIHDDFFELGGHSLQIATIIFRLKTLFQIDLPLRNFFNAPTIAQLADLVNGQRARQATFHGSPSFNWETEATLDESIYPKAPYAHVANPTHIFLTGATGFLGAFLLHELLQSPTTLIYCLVRAQDVSSGLNRIKENLKSYALWQESYAPRLVPVMGDLAQPFLGLSSATFTQLAQQIEAIYHCGAMVNLVLPYPQLKPHNVTGTHEILRLATWVKPIVVHYITTPAVFNSPTYFDGRLIYETDEPIPTGLVNGYSQSKWVAEKLMLIARSRQLPLVIYRPRLITGHSQTGAWKIGSYFTRFLKGWIEMGSMPDLDTFDIVPADYVSQVVVYLAHQPTSIGQTFLISSGQMISSRQLAEIIQALGYPMRLLPFTEWQHELLLVIKTNQVQVLFPLLSLFIGTVATDQQSTIAEMYTPDKEPLYDYSHLSQALMSTGIQCPPIHRDLFARYFAYFINQGSLPTPRA